MSGQTVTCPNCKHEFEIPVEKKSQVSENMLRKIEEQIDCLENVIEMKEKELINHSNNLKTLEDHIHKENVKINDLKQESKKLKTASVKKPDKAINEKLKNLENELMAHKMEIEKAQNIRSELVELNVNLKNYKEKMASMTQALDIERKKNK